MTWALGRAMRAAIAAHDIESIRGAANLQSITDFAAALCDAPIALVSLVEEQRQTFLARTGLEACETSRETSFCAFAMREADIMIVPDARADPRFADNALVTGDPFIRFYAGAPLVSASGHKLGTLCLIDRRARHDFTPAKTARLASIARIVMDRMELRRVERSRAS